MSTLRLLSLSVVNVCVESSAQHAPQATGHAGLTSILLHKFLRRLFLRMAQLQDFFAICHAQDSRVPSSCYLRRDQLVQCEVIIIRVPYCFVINSSLCEVMRCTRKSDSLLHRRIPLAVDSDASVFF